MNESIELHGLTYYKRLQAVYRRVKDAPKSPCVNGPQRIQCYPSELGTIKEREKMESATFLTRKCLEYPPYLFSVQMKHSGKSPDEGISPESFDFMFHLKVTYEFNRVREHCSAYSYYTFVYQ